MKHNLKITLFLIALFLTAQIVGLAILKTSMIETIDANGVKVVEFDSEKVGEVPEMTGTGFLLYIGLGILIGTSLVLLLAKFKKPRIWRAWFLLAVFISIEFALRVFISPLLATIIAAILALWKIYKPNVVVHNVTEVLMYSGIAMFLVPLLNSVQNTSVMGISGNVFWAGIILILISIYDFIAVFKSKHMVSFANFQTESKVFAGLMIKYTPEMEKSDNKRTTKDILKTVSVKTPSASKKKSLELPKLNIPTEKAAILGGGDIAFPLLFCGTVLFDLASKMPLTNAFLLTCIISVTTTIALTLLFFYAKKDKFYPAMPPIALGCFVGYLIVCLIV